jgi:hypothetical protein
MRLGAAVRYGRIHARQRIGKSEFEARQLVRAHRERYRKFWMMAEGAVACAMQGQSLQTVFGWAVHPGPYSKERSMLNFPMQANGAEMMRVAACLATEHGIEVCAPVHDAFLIEAPIERIEEDTQAMRGSWKKLPGSCSMASPRDRRNDRPLSRSLHGREARSAHVGSRHETSGPVVNAGGGVMAKEFNFGDYEVPPPRMGAKKALASTTRRPRQDLGVRFI